MPIPVSAYYRDLIRSKLNKVLHQCSCQEKRLGLVLCISERCRNLVQCPTHSRPRNRCSTPLSGQSLHPRSVPLSPRRRRLWRPPRQALSRSHVGVHQSGRSLDAFRPLDLPLLGWICLVPVQQRLPRHPDIDPIPLRHVEHRPRDFTTNSRRRLGDLRLPANFEITCPITARLSLNRIVGMGRAISIHLPTCREQVVRVVVGSLEIRVDARA